MHRRVQRIQQNRHIRQRRRQQRYAKRLEQSSLPNDVLIRIYNFITAPLDQHAFRCTCKRFQRMANLTHTQTPLTLSSFVQNATQNQRNWMLQCFVNDDEVEQKHIVQTAMQISIHMLRADDAFDALYSSQPLIFNVTQNIMRFQKMAWNRFKTSTFYQHFKQVKQWAKRHGAVETALRSNFGVTFFQNSTAVNNCIQQLWRQYGLCKKASVEWKQEMRVRRSGDIFYTPVSTIIE